MGPILSRRRLLQYGLGSLACAAGGTAAVCYFGQRVGEATASEVFRGGAPQGRLWEQWQKQGWAKEASHYLKLGENIQCKLCPNECLLEPEDRGRCRNRVFKDGKLYTMAYANPCALGIDPIEKKPLFHFLPATSIFSLATAGCSFRCLNCQNWDISQRKPEETKDPRGDPLRIEPWRLSTLTLDDINRLGLFPADIAAVAQYYTCPSIAYTYSEPGAWYEYMFDTARAARQKKIKNVWVTCGYLQEEPLVALCRYIDAASVNLKSFDPQIYKELNAGKLEPILATLKTLKREGVWFEVINLVVPTYTDKPAMIRRMCQWLLDNLGPDYPLHFSRFHAAHKLTHLPPTPADVLAEACAIAREVGLHYVYVGNCPGIKDAGTTFCPSCRKPVVQRNVYTAELVGLVDGKCKSCGTRIAGVWAA